MPRGYRITICAVGLAAILTALGTGAFFGSLYAPNHKQYQTVGGDNESRRDYNGPAKSLPDVAGLPGPVERAIANPPSPSANDHESRDLAAQEASAMWAFWMVCVSVFSALVTLAGTIMLYQQIVLTREAVEDTGLATKAMERQNELTEAAQRAWLSIEAEPATDFFFDRGEAICNLDIWLKNVGQKVATDIITMSIMRAKGVDPASKTLEIVQTLREMVEEKRKNPEYHLRSLIPNTRCDDGRGPTCQAEDNALYVVYVLASYRSQGTAPFVETWESFNVYQERNGFPHHIDRNINVKKANLAVRKSGIGGAT